MATRTDQPTQGSPGAARARTLAAAISAAGLLAATIAAPEAALADPGHHKPPRGSFPAPPGVEKQLAPREGDVALSSDLMEVRLDPQFPQVASYKYGDTVVPGALHGPLDVIMVDEQPQQVEVHKPKVKGNSAAYKVKIPGLKAKFNAVFILDGDELTFKIQDIHDPHGSIHRLRIPNQDIVTLTDQQPGAQISAQQTSVDRNAPGDRFETLTKAQETESEQTSHRILANTDGVGIAFYNNSTDDETAGGESESRSHGDSARWSRVYRQVDGHMTGSVFSGTWVHRGTTADEGIGPEEDPFWKVKFTGDRNNDGKVTWQDAAIAFRDLRPAPIGSDRVADTVITRIPFNIVSQATHPFLRTLDDTKRVSLATDGLRQQVMLKGYQAEGHDSAHPDYAGHYNERAGGKAEMDKLINEGQKANASFGVHVNTTESYSESKNFSEDLIKMPPDPAWGWMNQSYKIDQGHDLGSGKVVDRFRAFRDETPQNLDWVYIDVFYPNGWNGTRLGKELANQGWKVASEWSDKFPDQSVWSHWSQDENYGGAERKGWNSQIFRFEENTMRDQFNPDPILGNTNLKDFEGWTGQIDFNEFLSNVWQRNLPTKFLQQSPIMNWEDGKITFANGTVATSPDKSIDGKTLPTNRTINYDGAEVYRPGGSYLLPWHDAGDAQNSDDGQDRLYHYSATGGDSTWQLTKAWSGQTSLKLYKLTDTGREDAGTVPVQDGKVHLTGIASNTAYVLYPEGQVPAAAQPNWGDGTHVVDPGFNAGNLEAWHPAGEAGIERTKNGQNVVRMGPGGASAINQTLDLPAGTWSAWAWVEIEPGKSRDVTVGAAGQGVRPTELASRSAHGGDTPADGAETTVRTSDALNATASDDKLGTHFQRVRVTFTSDGSPVNFRVKAGEGDATVRVDDVRVVPWTEPKAPDTPNPASGDQHAAATTYFQDFEHVDTGYWPFVTGSANKSGDARTQLAERHEPYSQRGWYGKDASGTVVPGGKLVDNVLDGTWSLYAHEENKGQILRTVDGSLGHFEPGHRYRVSLDYQSAHAGDYEIALRHGSGNQAKRESGEALAEAHSTKQYSVEFTADDQLHWLEVNRLTDSAIPQADLILDNLRVEDLGPASDRDHTSETTATSATSASSATSAQSDAPTSSAEPESPASPAAATTGAAGVTPSVGSHQEPTADRSAAPESPAKVAGAEDASRSDAEEPTPAATAAAD